MEELHLRQIELAWCAGFFDGEGTTYVCRQSRKDVIYSSLRMTLPQAKDIGSDNPAYVLVRFLKALRQGNIRPRPLVPNRKPQDRWEAYNEECLKVFELLREFLSPIKIEQFQLAKEQVIIKPITRGTIKCRAGHLRIMGNVYKDGRCKTCASIYNKSKQ